MSYVYHKVCRQRTFILVAIIILKIYLCTRVYAQVFHVCAFTDEGLTQKSFLCPESTLFDQTILKCNWWFYVDCKSSKKLYDSNIPISKSYQLMKALTFFSSYSAGPTVDDSVAAATAAVSSYSDYSQVSGSSSNVATATTTTTTTTTASTETFDNEPFRR